MSVCTSTDEVKPPKVERPNSSAHTIDASGPISVPPIHIAAIPLNIGGTVGPIVVPPINIAVFPLGLTGSVGGFTVSGSGSTDSDTGVNSYNYGAVAGSSLHEVAQVLAISTATVERDARLAQAWLCRQMTGGATA